MEIHIETTKNVIHLSKLGFFGCYYIFIKALKSDTYWNDCAVYMLLALAYNVRGELNDTSFLCQTLVLEYIPESTNNNFIYRTSKRLTKDSQYMMKKVLHQ